MDVQGWLDGNLVIEAYLLTILTLKFNLMIKPLFVGDGLIIYRSWLIEVYWLCFVTELATQISHVVLSLIRQKLWAYFILESVSVVRPVVFETRLELAKSYERRYRNLVLKHGRCEVKMQCKLICFSTTIAQVVTMPKPTIFVQRKRSHFSQNLF